MRRTLQFIALFASGVTQAQNVIPLQISGQPLQYMKDGTVTGCGVRMVGVRPTAPGRAEIFDVSINVYTSGVSVLKGLSYNALANDATKITSIPLVFAACVGASSEALPRSAAVRAEFVRQNPCPITGQARGPCPGFQVDHVQPLCAGGPDSPENLHWLDAQSHKDKTRRDVTACRGRVFKQPQAGTNRSE